MISEDFAFKCGGSGPTVFRSKERGVSGLTSERLVEIKARDTGYEEGTMHSACGEYNCPCHYERAELIAEVERLRPFLTAEWEAARLREELQARKYQFDVLSRELEKSRAEVERLRGELCKPG